MKRLAISTIIAFGAILLFAACAIEQSRTVRYKKYIESRDLISYEELNKLVASDPMNAKLYENRGNRYLIDLFFLGQTKNKTQMLDKALSDFNKAIEIDPYSDAYSGRAQVYYVKGQYGSCISDCNKVIERIKDTDFRPTNCIHYQVRGLCYWELGNKKEACSDFKRACNLGDNCPDACANIKKNCQNP